MSEDTRPYYYRLRGRTLGPFDLRQIRQKAKQAQIGPGTPVSRDGIDWQTMADFPEISEADDPGVGGKGPVVPEEKWYYAVGGNQQGPVPLASLQQYVSGGMLKGDDVVIKEGGTEWLPVKSVPELYGLVRTDSEPTGQPPPSETNGLAIAGFVISLVGCGPLGLIGLILSLVALKSPNKSNRGLAIAGAVIGGLNVLACFCWIGLNILFAILSANS
jgi:hypothetical protein